MSDAILPPDMCPVPAGQLEAMGYGKSRRLSRADLERQLAEAQKKLDAVQELHAFDCTIDQACLVSRDDVARILKGG